MYLNQKWVQANGQKIKIKDMTLVHVINCLKMKKLHHNGTEEQLRERLGHYVYTVKEIADNVPGGGEEFWKY